MTEKPEKDFRRTLQNRWSAIKRKQNLSRRIPLFPGSTRNRSDPAWHIHAHQKMESATALNVRTQENVSEKDAINELLKLIEKDFTDRKIFRPA